MRAPSLCAGTVDTLGFLTPGPSILHTQAQAQGLKCWQRGNIKRLPSKLNVLPSGSRGHGGRPWRIPKEPWTRGMHWVPFSPLLVFHAMCPTDHIETQGPVGVTHQTWIHNLPPEERLQANHGHSETHPSERERKWADRPSPPSQRQQEDLQQILGGVIPRPRESSPGS